MCFEGRREVVRIIPSLPKRQGQPFSKAYAEGIIKIFDAEGTMKSETGQLEAGPILKLAAASEPRSSDSK